MCSQSQWSYERAKHELSEGIWRDELTAILYRPFDVRWTIFNSNVAVHRRERVMRHMLAGDNLALAFVRQVKCSPDWQHCFVADGIIESCLISNNTSEIGYLAPLYKYDGPAHREPNLNPALLPALKQAYRREPTPEDVFHYLYAVLYTPAYRAKYAEFLKMDFPRVPFTADGKLFRKLAALGARLTALHLLNSSELDTPACRFEGQGDGLIGKGRTDGLRYAADKQRVYINATQYFAPVSEAVWLCQVGGYQVCQKWMKDRRERHLELDEIRTYCRIVTALKLTLEIQARLDAEYATLEQAVVGL